MHIDAKNLKFQFRLVLDTQEKICHLNPFPPVRYQIIFFFNFFKLTFHLRMQKCTTKLKLYTNTNQPLIKHQCLNVFGI